MSISNDRPIAEYRICFIGAGSMAEAIIRGLVEGNIIAASNIFALNRTRPEALGELHSRYRIQVTSDPEQRKEFVRRADVIVLAVKPKDAQSAIEEFNEQFHSEQSIISVMAGMSIATLAALLPLSLPIIRTMPNTSSAIGKGVTGLSFSPHVTQSMQTIALEIFRSVGEVVTVEESQLELITGLTGSGPAYIYEMMDAMSSVAVAEGLPPETAKKLVAHTVLGAAEMVLQTDKNPAELRDQVTSPGGTTEAALHLMSERNFQDTVKSAVKRSAEKAAEIGRELSQQNKA